MMATKRPQQVKQPPSQKLLVTVPDKECRGVLPLQLNALARAVTATISENSPWGPGLPLSLQGAGVGAGQKERFYCVSAREGARNADCLALTTTVNTTSGPHALQVLAYLIWIVTVRAGRGHYPHGTAEEGEAPRG